jgi:hypothetical protein
MPEREGNIIQRGVQKGVDITRPLDVAAIAGGVIFANPVLLAGGVVGLVGGEMVISAVKPKNK